MEPWAQAAASLFGWGFLIFWVPKVFVTSSILFFVCLFEIGHMFVES